MFASTGVSELCVCGLNRKRVTCHTYTQAVIFHNVWFIGLN